MNVMYSTLERYNSIVFSTITFSEKIAWDVDV